MNISTFHHYNYWLSYLVRKSYTKGIENAKQQGMGLIDLYKIKGKCKGLQVSLKLPIKIRKCYAGANICNWYKFFHDTIN